MKNSIRSRLLYGLTAAIVSSWIGVIAASYFGAQREVGALFDTQLEQAARVATRTMFGIASPNAAEDGLEEKYKKHLVVQIWNDQGELVVNSRDGVDLPLDDMQTGFDSVFLDNQRWRIFSYRDDENGLYVRAGEPYLPRDYLSRHVLSQTLYPVFIGLPVVTLLIWLVVGRGFRPLKRLASEVHSRGSDNLEPIRAPYAPAEVQPLVNELNGVLERLHEKIDKERHFIGNAAHELRTPLAGLKAQAEVALSARTPEERERAIRHILTGVDRTGHLVNQLLTLSRLDESDHLTEEPVNLKDVAQQVLIDCLPSADQKSIELSLNAGISANYRVMGNRDGLYILARNLVDNAIKYSPRDSAVDVSLQRQSQAVELRVTDQGPGIPASERLKVFDRFHRRAGNTAYGTGLGLSIAKRVIELHQGEVVLSDSNTEGGLDVIVRLPSAPESAGGAPTRQGQPVHPGLVQPLEGA